MKNSVFSNAIWCTALAIGALAGCNKNDGPSVDLQISGPDIWERKYITLTGAFPEGTSAGDGGTMAYSITHEQAIDPNFEVDIFNSGYSLRSQRTARAQGSVNGNFLYNIQYVGEDGGIFNKYKVNGANQFEDTREEVDTEPILGAAPRWVVAAEGVGIGVYASATIQASAAGAGADFVDVKSTAKIAVLDLDNPEIIRQTEFTIPFTGEQTKAGYQIGRIDVPVLNAAKNKVFIGCNLTRTDPSKKSGVNDNGTQTWTAGISELGTATLIVDYPSLANPRLIFADPAVSKVNNHSYRTMTQYVGTDRHVYQATATSGSKILRISSITNDYDMTYNFDLKTALGTSNNVAIRAWRYLKDGKGIVLFTETGVAGGYIALIDLNAKTASRLSTEKEADAGYSGLTAAQNGGTALTGTLGQFQNIALAGDYVYLPMTPNGVDGNLYVINWKTQQIIKGAKLKNQSNSFYIGAY